MKRALLFATAVAVCAVSVQAVVVDPVAYWRFEEGPADAPVSHGGQGNGVFYPGVADSTGNGNELSVWAEGWAGYVYKTDVAAGTWDGSANNFSAKNSGQYPAMFTETGTAMQTWTPTAWTIEATFKLENTGNRHATIVGRDSRGTATTNADLAALYFQATPNDGLAIKFCDVAGYWHEVIAPANSFVGFDFPTNPDGLNTPWYSMAAVSDGATLSLWLRDVTAGGEWALLDQTDMTLSGSPDLRLTAGTGSGGDWQAGNWSVGRGLYAGGHGDRAYGFIDEVRITDGALTPDMFLTPEPTTMVLLGLGSLVAIRRRR